MLMVIVIAAIMVCCATGVYFGSLGVISVAKYIIRHSSMDTNEKLRTAKLRAMHFSLSATGFFTAVAIAVRDWSALVILLVFVGALWLDYVIYRAVTLGSN